MNRTLPLYGKIFLLILIIFSVETTDGEECKINVKSISRPLIEREVKLKLVYNVAVTGHVNLLELKMMIPDNIKDRQTVKSLNYSIQPDSIYKMNANTYALFRFRNIDKSFKITIKSHMLIFKSIPKVKDDSANDLSQYLVAERDIESNSPKILAVAATLVQPTDIETIIKTFDYVSANITYEVNQAIGAEKVLETKVGKCMDFSDLFVALLRANKIPAKSVFGMVVDYDGDNPLHAWPEAYLRKQGWIRFDPTTGHSEIKQSGKNYTMKIANKYIVLSEGRNDPELHTSQYQYRYDCTPGSKVVVKVSFDVAAQDIADYDGG